MANILFATLGESPIVVTAMVKALHEKQGIALDQVYVVYPDQDNFLGVGYDLIERALGEAYPHLTVNPVTLPFDDINSRKRCMVFLRQVATWLRTLGPFAQGVNTIYVSVAGGRKNMSALMWLPCLFTESVQGMFHLLDRDEQSAAPNFFSIEELDGMPEDVRLAKMFPPGVSIKLIIVPFTPLKETEQVLEQILKADASFTNESVSFTSPISSEWTEFFRVIFSSVAISDELTIYLSNKAVKQFRQFAGTPHHNAFVNFLMRMRQQAYLDTTPHEKIKKQHIQCKILPTGHIQERIFYYQDDSDVVVCELQLHDEYERILDNSDHKVLPDDHVKDIRLQELLATQGTLIMPLGMSPAIVPQTVKLLAREGKRVQTVVVVYPGQNQPIEQGVRWLQAGFQKRGIDFRSEPLEGLEDIATDEACETFMHRMIEVIQKYGQQSECDIWLSISGGRKTMAIFTMLAAQIAHIPRVYHTLITDSEKERDILHKGTIYELRKLSLYKRDKFLFPEQLDEEIFELFSLPIVFL